MTADFVLILDTKPPANPTLLIEEGATRTGTRSVRVRIASPDHDTGARDVSYMRIWGDVDPTGDPLVQPSQAGSSWQAYQEFATVLLSEGTGRKTISAALRDDVCNETLPFGAWIDLDTTIPLVAITQPVDRAKVSLAAPCNVATFSWQASVPFVRYEVRVVPGAGSPHGAGAALGSLHGSVGVAGEGSFAANAPITTQVMGADLQAASPGDTTKRVKVFIQDASGVWSA